MNRQCLKRLSPLRFKHFRRKSYALFCSLGKVVLICTLSVTTLTYAKADSISIRSSEVDSSGYEQIKQLDEVVVTGARAPLTAAQSAKIVAVISREQIERAAAQSVNDLLKLATGVDVRQRGGFGVQTDISINGGTFDQITILLNGINISSPQTGHNAADFPVALSDIERIEVLEGASARVFGSAAFNGAVNIVTRTDKQSNIRASAEAGSFGSVGGDAGITLATGNVSNQISGALQRSDGGTDNSRFIKRRVFYQGSLAIPLIDAQWQAGISSQDFGANTFYSSSYSNQFEATRRYLLSAKADIRPLTNEILILSPSAYWRRDYDHYQLIHGSEGAAAGENYHRTDVYGAGLNISAAWIAGKTAIGFDLRKEHILSTAYGTELDQSQWHTISNSDRCYDKEAERTNTSIFLEHNVVLSNLTVSAGILANKNTGLDSDFRFYPGIDISFRPTDNWKFYASWNKALRMPTYTDLYTNNAVQQGDPTLKPEKISTFKIGGRYRQHGWNALVSAFYSNGTDIIDWVYLTAESSKYSALNIGELDNMGLSADIELKPNELISPNFPITSLKVGYAFIHQEHETEQQIYGSLYALEYLKHKFTAQIDHRIISKLSASWALRWQKRMNGYSPYAKLDVKLIWSGSWYSLFVKADNITNHRYYDLGAVKQPGLWIMAGGSLKIPL